MRAQAATSIDAYHAFASSPKLGNQQEQIVAFLRAGGATRGEIAEGTGIRLSSVCGRIGELLKAGVVEECSRRPCAVSGVGSHVVRLLPAQRALFEDAA